MQLIKKYFFIFIILTIISSSPLVYADTQTATGFIPGQIWYSKEPLAEGDTVKIYTAIWNGNTSSISAHVEFYDVSVLLGYRDVEILPSHLQDVSISWKVTSGEHNISAKISSSSIINNGKKEQITLSSNTTSSDHTFVPITIKTIDGVKATSADVVKDDIAKVGSTIKGIVPDSVGTPVSNGINLVDSFRSNTYKSIAASKDGTQKEIDAMNTFTKVIDTNTTSKSKDIKTISKVEQKQSKPLDATDKPIAYVKLFLLSVLGFIFGSKIVFYGVIITLLFLTIRFIYRKIKYR